MRDLQPSDKTKLTVFDAIGGGDVDLFYRMPTTKERTAYSSSLVKRKGNKIINKTGETRIRFGLDILTGVQDGYFSYGGQPVSSDPNSPDYREDWKDLVEKTASDLISALSVTVFEGVRPAGGDVEMVSDDEEAEDAVPLSTSCGD